MVSPSVFSNIADWTKGFCPICVCVMYDSFEKLQTIVFFLFFQFSDRL